MRPSEAEKTMSVMNLPARVSTLTDSEIDELGEKCGIYSLKKDLLHPNGPSIWELNKLYCQPILLATFGSDDMDNTVFQDKITFIINSVCYQVKQMKDSYRPIELPTNHNEDFIFGKITLPFKLPYLIHRVKTLFSSLEKDDENTQIVTRDTFLDIFKSVDDEFQSSDICKWLRSMPITANRLFMIKTRLIWLIIHLRIASTRLDNCQTHRYAPLPTVSSFFGQDNFVFDNSSDFFITEPNVKVITLDKLENQLPTYWNKSETPFLWFSNAVISPRYAHFLDMFFKTVHEKCQQFFRHENREWISPDIKDVHKISTELMRFVMYYDNIEFYVKELIPSIEQLEKLTSSNIQLDLHFFAREHVDKFQSNLKAMFSNISRKEAEDIGLVLLNLQADILIDFMIFIFKRVPKSVVENATPQEQSTTEVNVTNTEVTQDKNVSTFSKSVVRRRVSNLPLLEDDAERMLTEVIEEAKQEKVLNKVNMQALKRARTAFFNQNDTVMFASTPAKSSIPKRKAVYSPNTKDNYGKVFITIPREIVEAMDKSKNQEKSTSEGNVTNTKVTQDKDVSAIFKPGVLRRISTESPPILKNKDTQMLMKEQASKILTTSVAGQKSGPVVFGSFSKTRANGSSTVPSKLFSIPNGESLFSFNPKTNPQKQVNALTETEKSTSEVKDKYVSAIFKPAILQTKSIESLSIFESRDKRDKTVSPELPESKRMKISELVVFGSFGRKMANVTSPGNSFCFNKGAAAFSFNLTATPQKQAETEKSTTEVNATNTEMTHDEDASPFFKSVVLQTVSTENLPLLEEHDDQMLTEDIEETFEWTNTDFFESSENVTFPHNPMNYTCAADVPIVITLTEPEMSTFDIKTENTDVTMDQDASPVSSPLERNSIDDDQELDAEVEEPAVKRLDLSDIEAIAEKVELAEKLELKEHMKQWMVNDELSDDWKDAMKIVMGIQDGLDEKLNILKQRKICLDKIILDI